MPNEPVGKPLYTSENDVFVVHSGQAQLLRFFLTLLKDKTIFPFILRCQYSSLTPDPCPIVELVTAIY